MITCDQCNADCCRFLGLEIETPKTKEDFEDMKWYLYHDKVSLYIDNEGDWIVLYPSRCRHLKGKKCMIYDKRPPICRKSKVKDCERNVKEIRVMFRTVKDLEEYLKKRRNKKSNI